jgi:DNA-directed RNA polymerase subunit alpha
VSKPLPWVKFESVSDGGGRFVVSPLERGMGTTLGNALRRVLLSSLSGYAATSIKIDGVTHEFSTISGVVEDVLDVIANIKGVIFDSDQEGPFKLTLDFSKKGSLKASNFKLPSDLKVLNPDCHIAEVTEASKVTMDITVEKGMGYYPTEAQDKSDQPIDTINIDASFSPIIRVNHQVENIRVGKELDYDSLMLDVWTNGSVRPEDAVKKAAEILTSKFQLFGDMNNNKSAAAAQPQLQAKASDKQEQAKQTHESKNVPEDLTVDDLELSARSSNCLKRAGIESVMDLVNRDISELIQIKNFGKKSADEINDKLKQYGLVLKGVELI